MGAYCAMQLLEIGSVPDCITKGESCGMCVRGGIESVGFFFLPWEVMGKNCFGHVTSQ